MATMIPRPTTTSAAATTRTKNTADLAADVVQLAGEGDEGEVGGVQHQLDAHEHHEHVAPHEQADGADREEHRGERRGTRRPSMLIGRTASLLAGSVGL